MDLQIAVRTILAVVGTETTYTLAHAHLLLHLASGRLVQEIHLGEDIDVGELQRHHGGEGRHDSGEELGRLHEELGIEKEHSTETEVPLLELVDELPHCRDVCVELDLT